MNATKGYTLGIDLGGTNIKGGVCDADNALIVRHSIPTEAHAGFDHVFERLVQFVDQAIAKAQLDRDQVSYIGIGAPGPMSHSQGMIYHAPNLPGWENVPLRDRLAEATGLPVTLENDANAAAFGEFARGAGQDVSSIVMLTLGTGVGGGVILDGKLWRGTFDNAGEIGHTIIVPRGRPCPCGQTGCFERYASANAVGERLVEAIESGEASALAQRLESDERINSQHVLEAAQAGDALAKRIWDETCFYLAVACVNLQHTLNPQRIVLAGGLINAGAALLDSTTKHFEALSWKIAQDHPEIVFATLGTDAGTIGAAALAQQEARGVS
jgi:glucokinase